MTKLFNSQTYRIWRHLRLVGSITPLQALRRYGCMRLSARILDLRRMGEMIKTDIVAVKCRGGKVAHVARYSMSKS